MRNNFNCVLRLFLATVAVIIVLTWLYHAMAFNLLPPSFIRLLDQACAALVVLAFTPIAVRALMQWGSSNGEVTTGRKSLNAHTWLLAGLGIGAIVLSLLIVIGGAVFATYHPYLSIDLVGRIAAPIAMLGIVIVVYSVVAHKK